MARPKLALPIPRDLLIWAGVTVLVGVGLLVTLLQYTGLEKRESQYATQNHQRIVFDAEGHVMGEAKKPAEPTFDVAPAEPEKPVEPEKPAEPKAETPASATEPTKTEPAKAEEKPTAPSETAPAEKPTEPKPGATMTPPAPTPSAAPAEPLPAGLVPLRATPLPSETPAMAAPTTQSLIHAPAPEITETVDGLKLPKRGANGTAASTLYARRFKGDKSQHLISFVVLDAGLGTSTLPLLLALPKEVTVAFSPYSRGAAANIELLRNVGFEVWGMLPTIGEHYPQDDPGPLGLIQSMPKEELLRRLHEVMGATVGSVGMVLPPDETLSARANSFGHVLNELHARGLYLLSTNPARSMEQLSANPEMQPSITRADIVLDPMPNEPQIKSKLAGIRAAANEKGGLIVVLSARPQSLALLQQWLNSNSGLALAPLSSQYEKPPAPAPAPEKKPGEKAASPEKKPDAKPSEKPPEKHE